MYRPFQLKSAVCIVEMHGYVNDHSTFGLWMSELSMSEPWLPEGHEVAIRVISSKTLMSWEPPPVPPVGSQPTRCAFSGWSSGTSTTSTLACGRAAAEQSRPHCVLEPVVPPRVMIT